MTELTIEELVQGYQTARAAIEEQEAAQSVIKDEIVARLTEMGLDGMKTKNGYTVTKVVSAYFGGITVAQARELGCTVQKEEVDLGKLRELHKRGVPVPETKTIIRLLIKETEKHE